MYNILNEISDLWGFCPFDKVKDTLIECRAKSRLPQNAQTVIVFAFPYLLPEEKYEGLNVSKYAAVEDYHGIVPVKLQQGCNKLKELYPGEEFVCFSDNSPIPEVYACCEAGIGVKGANSLLITEKYGSFVFLGEIVTTLALESERPAAGMCTNCGRCSKACPTGAIENGIINREKCLSHITQKKGELTPEEKELIKKSGCAWGCDICQNVCPLNKNAGTTGIEEFIVSSQPEVTLDTEIEGRAFAWRGEKVIKRNLELLEDDNGS